MHEYEYLISDYQVAVLVNVQVDDDTITCNFAGIKKAADKTQIVYPPDKPNEKFLILLPDDAVDQVCPVALAGEVIFPRILNK